MTNLFKKSFLVMSLFCGIIAFSQEKLSFAKLGYPSETSIVGHKAEREFYFKVENSKNVDFKSSSVHLEFSTSQVIDVNKSYLTISINNTPMVTKFVNNTNLVVFDIPLKKEYVKSGYIMLSIKTNLRIDDVICENYFNDAYWVKLTQESYLNLELNALGKSKRTTTFKDIASLLPNLKYLVVNDNVGIKEIEYASSIKFNFNRAYGSDLKVLKLSEFDQDTLKRALILAPYKSLKPELKTGLPTKLNDSVGYVTIFNKTTLVGEVNQNLLVTANSDLGFKKAAHFLLYKHLRNSAYTNSIVVNTVPEQEKLRNRKEFSAIYFEELAADSRLQKGTGSMPVSITLPRALFGSNVKNMVVQITGKYRPVSQNESAYFNLYFNDQLLNSYKLDDKGILNINLEFEGIVMKKQNSFKYEYYHLPEGGICNTNAPDFYGQVNNLKSYFKPTSYMPSNNLVFSSFPENFQKNPLAIYTDLPTENSASLIDSFAELLDVINPGEIGFTGFIYPQFKNADEETIKTDSKFSKIIISANKDKFSALFDKEAYIKFKKDEVVYKSKRIVPYIDLSYKEALGFNQLFYYKNNPVMLVNVDSKSDDKTLFSLLSNIREQTSVNKGNIIVSKDTKAYYFDLRSIDAEDQESYAESFFHDFWSKYGLFVILMLLVLVALLLSYVYKKSQQSKDSITHAN